MCRRHSHSQTPLAVACDYGKLCEAQGRFKEDGPRVNGSTHRVVDDRKGMAGHLGMRLGGERGCCAGAGNQLLLIRGFQQPQLARSHFHRRIPHKGLLSVQESTLLAVSCSHHLQSVADELHAMSRGGYYSLLEYPKALNVIIPALCNVVISRLARGP